MNKMFDVGGIKVSLSEFDGILLSKFLAQANPVPDLKALIKTDESGFIVSFEPSNMAWSFVFFIQNLMITQRLHLMDDFMRKEGLIK